jgi:hypothetical protein
VEEGVEEVVVGGEGVEEGDERTLVYTLLLMV